jgi:hypothetical protein
MGQLSPVVSRPIALEFVTQAAMRNEDPDIVLIRLMMEYTGMAMSHGHGKSGKSHKKNARSHKKDAHGDQQF